MSETSNIVYGRLLEAAHISGYGFERMTRELELLLGGDDWRTVGPGFEDVNAFLASIDLSAFNIQQRAKLNRRIKELQPAATERAISKATGTPKTTVHRQLNPPGPDGPEKDPASTGNDSPLGPSGPASALQRPAAEVAKHADKAARKDAAAEETKQRRERSRGAEPLPDGAERRIGDAREVLADVADDSVALVLTDPPYGDESRPLYSWLGEWAARVLVPGGSLVCYTGQSRLDLDMATLGRELRYWWLFSMQHSQAQRLPGKFVIAEFKPVLWYVKDFRRGRTLINDVLRPATGPDKDHAWGQAEGGVTFLIENLTEPGELIADPFAGSETWGKISANMGRRWIGADVADNFEAGVTA